MVLNQFWTVWMYLLAFPTWTCHAVEVLAVCIAGLSQPCEGPRRQVQDGASQCFYKCSQFMSIQLLCHSWISSILPRHLMPDSLACKMGAWYKKMFMILLRLSSVLSEWQRTQGEVCFVARVQAAIYCKDEIIDRWWELSLCDKTADGPYWPLLAKHAHQLQNVIDVFTCTLHVWLKYWSRERNGGIIWKDLESVKNRGNLMRQDTQPGQWRVGPTRGNAVSATSLHLNFFSFIEFICIQMYISVFFLS